MAPFPYNKLTSSRRCSSSKPCHACEVVWLAPCATGLTVRLFLQMIVADARGDTKPAASGAADVTGIWSMTGPALTLNGDCSAGTLFSGTSDVRWYCYSLAPSSNPLASVAGVFERRRKAHEGSDSCHNLPCQGTRTECCGPHSCCCSSSRQATAVYAR